MLLEQLRRAAEQRHALALTRRRRVAHTACAPHQAVGEDGSEPESLLTFCSNDYMGLANHPDVIAALVEGAQRYGAGSGASHLVSGHSLAHTQLEAELARWLAPHIPHACTLYFCTGYMANMAVLTALGTAGATLFCESLNHASLIDGARLARADVQRYPHCDTAALEALLAASTSERKLIVTDSVFSMDGNVAPLRKLLELAERHDAWIIVDDAHGFGVLGEQGHGVLEALGLSSERLIYIGTLGKAAGVAGAFVAAHETIIEHLVNTARPYIYTTAAPPAVAHALLASLAIIEGEEGTQRRAQLTRCIGMLREGLAQLAAIAGWTLGDSETAIQPLIVGDNGAALALSATLEADGIRVGAIRPPTVPEGTARLRITLSAAHTEDDVRRLLDALSAAVAQREVA
ncbi:8-amino-7-oxononanoate synthase [Cupriavidus necator]|uniref:8-amino-7-oxononanoate synthase n=2 Tax=Cupriavidus necator (strain ATCC 17699 / DSM 428 / KCTC 22496 / NCIMB 10442 / H16 / Stanier 337) TaxID=381666 RepID=BIOF_CUPNH|nr:MULTISPECIES: 8-amino-7-oxononanoate synthase [Cupriavidus]Q0KF88.1 RecName: Full=8-amino-7-oxononanoate synthase; Short=AONS; AltName: Full=7-keto-8-amino-pelargonic acid synthase; Short=7-KAP synthase; Short=KAPA synthase; AltName: Full=8-amino-7-ketopelargonate synthase [Cupriavidus necator H16]EON17480.1 8-amino-7-oxononanoate synthase [Cupriavidus sp. GA3-3]QCB99293.1 8-amino-7-oxononanoate synthase [Cupriavidus necator H16]QQB77889.1 8-amino-7-oxononanoate synthase [Cupriavidus necator